MEILEVMLLGLFLRVAIYHVRKRQYLQMIGWLLFAQVLIQALDAAEYAWDILFLRLHR